MYRIGIDVGSTYTKYCVINGDTIEALSMEKTPIRQREFFEDKVLKLKRKYDNACIVSCGYGKKNVEAVKNINELSALAKGAYHLTRNDGIVLDIGGQDTKVIMQQKGVLKEFFLNDKCAAGSGMFLINTLNMLGLKFEELVLEHSTDNIHLSSTCAVFAQSEIVELIANNIDESDIIKAVVRQMLVKARPLLDKVKGDTVLLSGGLSGIKGMADFATDILGCNCIVTDNGAYITAVGCAI